MIGIDFDNTIVCYDDVFYQIAVSEGVIPITTGRSKGAVRDWLRAAGREEDWTALQGLVYGARIHRAPAFPGFLDFLRRCRTEGQPVAVVSHKTRHPFAGPPYDLHAAARGWLEQLGVFDDPAIGLTPDRVFFEPAKSGKLNRIASLSCSVFIDDLPEFLSDPGFPVGVRRIHFDPHATGDTPADCQRAGDWDAVAGLILGGTPS
ncbi:hypothetical protein M2352_005219 [Azospirillum fermentarium]|uniref:HAD family hydrolase n=1 Tax=Azospirillum fermentarium TaxID=1233114 RepID=UPI0022272368|nr:HAD family hydrolase [Azospirillum fermentarium]MCW2249536.1 hypothetical protein [Azospirillum fermentarium]